MRLDDAGQIALDDQLQPRRPGDPKPGREAAPVFEQSVQSRYLDEAGRELPNPIPLSPPVGYKKAPSIADQMRAMIRQASYEASQMGAETEEEANDFDVGEDMEPHSPWEHDFDINPEYEALLALQSAPPGTPPRASAAPPAAPPSAPPVADPQHQAPVAGTAPGLPQGAR